MNEMHLPSPSRTWKPRKKSRGPSSPINSEQMLEEVPMMTQTERIAKRGIEETIQAILRDMGREEVTETQTCRRKRNGSPMEILPQHHPSTLEPETVFTPVHALVDTATTFATNATRRPSNRRTPPPPPVFLAVPPRNPITVASPSHENRPSHQQLGADIAGGTVTPREHATNSARRRTVGGRRGWRHGDQRR